MHKLNKTDAAELKMKLDVAQLDWETALINGMISADQRLILLAF
jgi:hypothetical protein